MTSWFAMSAQFVGDPKIEAVGEECGPAGPLAAVALLCQAKIQGNGGRVERTYRALAHDIFADRDQAVSALRALVSAGVLTLEEESETAFVVVFPQWRRWQENFRKARERAQKAQEQADVRTRPQVSGSRPKTSPTQTQTLQGQTPPAPQRGEPVFPESSGSRRQRDNAKMDAERAAWAAEHMPDIEPRAVSNAAHRARMRGLTPTPTIIRAQLGVEAAA